MESLLSLSINQTIVPKTARGTLSAGSGWFLIRLLVARASLPNVELSSKGIEFSKETLIKGNAHKMYLTHEQAEYIQSKPKYFEIDKLMQKMPESLITASKRKSALSDSSISRYIVKSTKNWKPENNELTVKELTTGIFSVTGKMLDILKLSSDSRVDTISEPLKLTIKNRFNAGYLQTGDFYGKYVDTDREIERKLTNIGLNGRGQVVNVVDTGIDVLHPFFYDGTQEVKYFNSSKLEYNANHRKIVSVLTASDSSDYEGGHGTHCSGTVLGKANCTECGINKYAGMAPEAKLFMIDICKGDSASLDGSYDLLNITEQMGEELGCRVSSNSWSGETIQLQLTRAYDMLGWLVPETLNVFAAGNEGANFTIFSPSDSKNALTVGAMSPTYPMNARFYASALIQITEGNTTINVNKVGGTGSHDVRETMNPPQKWINVPIANESDDNKGKIVLTQVAYPAKYERYNKGVCEKAIQLEKEGAIAMIFNSSIAVGAYCNTTLLPIYYASPENYTKLTKFQTVTLNFTDNGKGYNYPGLAYFSSSGPIWNCLMKPDITAPGYYTLSAKARPKEQTVPGPLNYSALKFMSGTSMAAPAAAGIATLVREFFTDGWYETLEEYGSESINATAALLRASLIASARLPKDDYKAPNSNYGYGVPNLMNIFPFEDKDEHGFRFIDNITSKDKSQDAYRINVTNDKHPLVIALSYIDDVISSDYYQTLVIDLDLVVTSPSGKVYYGNKGTQTKSSESFSTNERVYIEEPEIGEYKIRIISNDYDSNYYYATYAIAVSGGFPHEDESINPYKLPTIESETCPNCKGTCINGYCSCPNDRAGVDCSQEIITIEPDKAYKFSLNHREIEFYKVNLGKFDSKNKPTITINSQYMYVDGYYSLAIASSPFDNVNSKEAEHLFITKSTTIARLDGKEGKDLIVYFALYASLPNNHGYLYIKFSTNKKTPTPTPKSDSHSQGGLEEGDNQKLTSKYIFLALTCIFFTLGICCIVAYVLITKYETNTLLQDQASKSAIAV